MENNFMNDMYAISDNEEIKSVNNVPKTSLTENKSEKINIGILSKLEQRITSLEKKLQLNENRIRLLQASVQTKENQIRALKNELSNKIGYE